MRGYLRGSCGEVIKPGLIVSSNRQPGPAKGFTDRQNRWYVYVPEAKLQEAGFDVPRPEDEVHLWCFIPKRGRNARYGADDAAHAQQPNNFPDQGEQVDLYSAVDPQPYQMTISVQSYVQRGRRTDVTQHLIGRFVAGKK